jgi:glutamate synthase (NADPH/NADH) small chain
LRRANLLPEICGFVCPVEVQCQGHCIEQHLAGEAIPIARIQRYIAERARREGWTALDLPAATTGKRVAIIGAGPAGLACAAGLIEQGHEVTVIERTSQPGGKAVSVIPRRRLPAENAEAEIGSVFTPVSTDRLEWRWNTSLGRDYTLEDVIAEGFDAVVLALGLGNTASLADDQSRPEGVMDALAFLQHMNRNERHRVRGKVAVIGGGNTAIDAASMAKQRGADDVYVLYRRSLQETPAWPAELRHAMDSGVHFLILTQPVGYEQDDNGVLKAVRVVRTELGEPDRSGRRSPVPDPASEHSIRVNMAIEAIGETLPPGASEVLGPVELTAQGLVKTDPNTGMTNRPGVFAAGDLVNGGQTVARAVAEGREVARHVGEYLARHAPQE